MAVKKKVVKKAPMPLNLFYKVINTVDGHNGVKYKVGINTDPKPIPLSDIPSCGGGAIYFIKADEIMEWLDKGDSIAQLVPVGEFERDEDKYRAHSIKILKIVPIAEANAQFGLDLDMSDILDETVFCDLTKAQIKAHMNSSIRADFIDGFFLDDFDDALDELMPYLTKAEANKVWDDFVDADTGLNQAEIEWFLSMGITDFFGRHFFEANGKPALVKRMCEACKYNLPEFEY